MYARRIECAFCRIFVFLFIIWITSTLSYAVTGENKQGSHVFSLEKVINEVLESNPMVKQIVEKEMAAEEGERSAFADFFPKFSLSYSYLRLKDVPFGIFTYPQFPGTGAKVPIGEKSNFSWSLKVAQPVFTGFALITKRRMAQLGVDLQKIRKEQIEMELVKQAKLLYYRALLAKHFLNVARDEVKQLTAHVKDAEQFYKQGLIPYNDLLKSKVALAHAKQNFVRAENNLKTALAALNIIMNREISEIIEIEDVPIKFMEDCALEELYKEAIEKRPEIRAIKIALKQARLNVKLAESEYYPKVFIVGAYFQEGDNPAANHNDFKNSHNASVGFEAQWPFFEWGKTRSHVQRAIHEKLALEYELERVVNEIKLEVKNAHSMLETAKQNIQTAKIARIQARENFRITDMQYKQNITTSTEVLDARTFLTEAETNYFNAVYGYLSAKAELWRAVGKKVENK